LVLVWEDQFSSQAKPVPLTEFAHADGDFVEKLLLAVVIELFEHTFASRFVCQDLTAVVLAYPAKT
jgi:hypothetical protein